MEFLLIWVLGGDVIDSGLRYKSAAKCFSVSQNAATEMRDVGLTSPQFTCIPVAKGKDFKIYRKDSYRKCRYQCTRTLYSRRIKKIS